MRGEDERERIRSEGRKMSWNEEMIYTVAACTLTIMTASI